MYEGKIATVVDEVVSELERATLLHVPMFGASAGYAVLQKEVEELWEEVKDSEQSKERMKKEAIQIAAMAMRFILDCCGNEDEEDET